MPLREDDLPSPGIYLVHSGRRVSGQWSSWGGSGEGSIWGSGAGTGRKLGERKAARARVHVVGVRRFHSNFGSLGSGVSEGVTNQRPETGINYANHHLAMGQMTPIV